MRQFLDGLYRVAEWAAMAALCAIAVLVFAQVSGRVFDTLLVMTGGSPYGFLIPSLAEIAGFLLVGASFLALAGSFRAGSHIRVTLALMHLPEKVRRASETAALALAGFLSSLLALYTTRLAWDSFVYGEKSFGIIAVPLSLPQGVMALGALVFAVATIDDLVAALRGERPQSIAKEEEGAGDVA